LEFEIQKEVLILFQAKGKKEENKEEEEKDNENRNDDKKENIMRMKVKRR